MTQHSVEERFCNQGLFNSSAALTLPDFALTLHTNPSHVARKKYSRQEKRNTLIRKREIHWSGKEKYAQKIFAVCGKVFAI